MPYVGSAVCIPLLISYAKVYPVLIIDGLAAGSTSGFKNLITATSKGFHAHTYVIPRLINQLFVLEK